MYNQEVQPKFGVAPWAMGFLALFAAVSIVAVFSNISESRLLDRVERGEFVSYDELVDNDDRQALVLGVQFLLLVVSGITYLIWVRTMRKNLDVFGIGNLRFSVGWAVGWHIVPIMALFRPYQVIKEIWYASNPIVSHRNEWERRDIDPGLLQFWWIFYVVWSVSQNVINFVVDNSDSAGALSTSAMLAAIWDVGGIIGAIMTIIVVREITKRQQEKWLLPSSVQVARSSEPYGSTFADEEGAPVVTQKPAPPKPLSVQPKPITKGYRKAQLPGEDLSGRDFQNENMMSANLEGANLRGTDLQGAQLHFTNLKGATLVDANLREAVLVEADLRGADMNGSDMLGAILSGPFKGETIFDDTTILPDGGHWSDETDMKRFTDASHPQFWRAKDTSSPASRPPDDGDSSA